MEPTKTPKRNKEEWIQKDTESEIPKLDKKAIFVPLETELNF